MIYAIQDIQQLIRLGETDWKQYGEVNAVYHQNMVLFNYTAAAQYVGRWNWFEQNARGLIFDSKTGEIIARPFRKFFNYGERLPLPGTQIVEVSEKMDGSLGILYQQSGQFHFATRGSFVGDQAVWATRHLYEHHRNLEALPQEYTLLFEIVYPQNRVVINYGDLEALVLIGARHKVHGYEMYASELDVIAEQWGFLRPKTYALSDWNALLNAAQDMGANEEGFVIRTSDNERYKIKSDAYKVAHRLMTQVSFKQVLEAYWQNTLEESVAGVPDEFLGEIKAHVAVIEKRIADITYAVEEAWKQLPERQADENEKQYRKRVALWINANHKQIGHYLFGRLDHQDILPKIRESGFKDLI